MKCKECGEEILNKRNQMFCSVRCRNTVNGKNHIGCKKQFHMFCKYCGIHYTVPLSKKENSKYCSKKCHGAARRITDFPLQVAMS